MKAAVLTGPESIPSYADFDEPTAQDGFDLVELVAAGIHPVVRSLASGDHYGSAGVWPVVPGLDAVARTRDGELVYTGFTAPPFGTLAERMSVPNRMRIPLPAGVDAAQVAGGLNPGLPSWLPLKARLREVAELGTVLVLGATGMAGFLAVQNARLLGAKAVVAVGRREAALARAAEHGATATARLTGDVEADAEAIAAALDGIAPSLVLDYLWGTPAQSTLAALGRRGMDEDDADISYVQIGSMAGPDAAVPSSLLRSRRIRISGSGAGSASMADVLAELPVYMGHIAAGSVTVPVRVFPLSRVADAWAVAGDGGTRVVVVSDADYRD